MIFVDPADVIIPENRIRRAFDEKKLRELKDSILRNGLFHPPTVERNGDKWILRAGERRLRVCKEILAEGKTFRVGIDQNEARLLAVIEYGELTEIQRLEIEIEETVVRADFSWQERDQGYAALHALRSKQNPGQTVKATASEIAGRDVEGGSAQAVADALVTSRYLHIPEVAGAKTSKEALKVIRKLADVGHRAKLAAASLEIKTPHTLIKGDSLETLKKLEASFYDVVLTDPIYGIGADNFGDMAGTGHKYEDNYTTWKKFMSEACDELWRVTKPQAHVYLFCDQRRFEELKTFMTLANFQVMDTMLIWDKSPTGMLPWPDHGPRRCYECILYAWKGDRKSLVVKPDVISVPAVRKLVHGAQKPVSLYLDLLSRSANPGDTVLDFMGGSGTILVAANIRRLVATYVEGADDAFNIAQLRKDIKEIDDGAEEDDGLGDIPV